jgi:hypothetical protein
MWNLLELTIFPAFVIGVVLGLLVAVGFRYLAPVDVDTISAGAWFVVVGGAAGLLWQFIFSAQKIMHVASRLRFNRPLYLIAFERCEFARTRNVTFLNDITDMKKLIAALVVTLFPLAGLAQASDCNSHKSIAARAQIDEALQAMGKDQDNRRARLDLQLEAKAATLGWSKERLTELRTQVFSSAAYWAFEKEKHRTSLRSGVQLRQVQGQIQVCPNVKRLNK